jgi:hypothetical protein
MPHLKRPTEPPLGVASVMINERLQVNPSLLLCGGLGGQIHDV